MKFYYAPNSCALASHIALIEAEVPHQAIRMSFAAADQRKPEFLAINPKGRVPALVTEHGILTETPAILAFVAQSHPHAGLAPVNDPFAFAEVQAFNSYLCSTVHVAHAHGVRGLRWADDPAAIAEMKRKAPQAIGDVFGLIEAGMLKGPWVMGETYTVCDPYLFTLAQWLESDGVDISKLPRVLEHRQRVSQRPGAKRAIAIELALAA